MSQKWETSLVVRLVDLFVTSPGDPSCHETGDLGRVRWGRCPPPLATPPKQPARTPTRTQPHPRPRGSRGHSRGPSGEAFFGGCLGRNAQNASAEHIIFFLDKNMFSETLALLGVGPSCLSSSKLSRVASRPTDELLVVNWFWAAPGRAYLVGSLHACLHALP